MSKSEQTGSRATPYRERAELDPTVARHVRPDRGDRPARGGVWSTLGGAGGRRVRQRARWLPRRG